VNITLLGSYLPKLSADGIQSFIDRDIEEFIKTIRELREKGVTRHWPEDVLQERAVELRAELREDLNHVALFEVEVTGNDNSLDILNFQEPETTCCAWAHAYLTLDGDATLQEPHEAPPSGNFRLAFYIQDWKDHSTLVGPLGPIEINNFQVVPERLWRLAPYELLD